MAQRLFLALVLGLSASLASCSKTKESDVKKDVSAVRSVDIAQSKASSVQSISGKSEEFVPDRVFFDFDASSVNAEYQSYLDTQVKYIKSGKFANIVLSGYCDERGGIEYNYALGEKRAQYVKDYYVRYGISPATIKTVSYGKEIKLVHGDNDDAYMQNRAVTIEVK